MPALYAEPVKLLQSLSERIQDGWILIHFDYLKEQMILRRGDSVMKAVLVNGIVEWKVIKDPPMGAIGTNLFYVI